MGCPHQTLERSLECAGKNVAATALWFRVPIQGLSTMKTRFAGGGGPNNPKRYRPRLLPHSKYMSAAKTLHILKQEEFDRLLKWLDPEPERAGLTYEKIRWRLVAILASRGCTWPEELADETIDRVARRVIDIQDSYVGDQATYFLGVMNNVHHEYLKRPMMPRPPEPDDDVETKERTYLCLEKCLNKLSPNSRQMIEQYYAEDGRAKIDLRKRIAAELGIGLSTLRLRALRIRDKLQMCIDQCLVSEARP
jgi:DNA-directed RNA polymerase specialized sigma24 family protein